MRPSGVPGGGWDCHAAGIPREHPAAEKREYWQATGRAEVECSGLSNNLGILALSIQVFSKGTEEGALPRMDPFLASPDASCGWKNVGLGFLSFKGV